MANQLIPRLRGWKRRNDRYKQKIENRILMNRSADTRVTRTRPLLERRQKNKMADLEDGFTESDSDLSDQEVRFGSFEIRSILI